jgi:hypothetical protein
MGRQPDTRRDPAADPGYGDVIQFARIRGPPRGAKLAIACSAELHPVIEQLAGPVVHHWERAPAYTAYCALSACRGWPARAPHDPGRNPYLADPARSAIWAERFRLLPRRLSPHIVGRPADLQ